MDVAKINVRNKKARKIAIAIAFSQSTHSTLFFRSVKGDILSFIFTIFHYLLLMCSSHESLIILVIFLKNSHNERYFYCNFVRKFLINVNYILLTNLGKYE